MQVDVAKRVSHGVQFHVAYTFGKSIDTLSASEADDSLSERAVQSDCSLTSERRAAFPTSTSRKPWS